MTTERRWSEGDAPEEVRRLLDSAVIDEPTAEQLASLEAKMAGVLGAAPVAPAAGGAGVAVKIIGSVALLAVGIGAGIWLGRRSEPSQAVTVVTKPELPSPQPFPEGRGSPTVVLPIPEPVVPVKPSMPMRRPVVPPAMQKPEVVVEEEEDELTLLQAAMSAPSAEESLRLVERHQAKFPQSDLAQEREVLAIKALVRLERFDDARARAEQFKARWPTSPHALRVEALLKQVP